MSEKKGAAKVQQEKRTAVIYGGPTIAGVVAYGTVFNNGLTPQVEKAASEEPAIKRLLVPVTDLARLRKDLKNKESAASICYIKVAEYAGKRGKG